MKNANTAYEIRPDNADPARAEEWAVYALAPNCHARRVAVTTDKAEAEAMLLGLVAGAEMLTACKVAERMMGCTDDNDMAGLRSAIAKAEAK